MIGCWLDIAYTIKLRISVQFGSIFEYKYVSNLKSRNNSIESKSIE